MLIGLPLAGVTLAGKPLDSYLEFPPITRYVQHAPFSWLAFGCISMLIVIAVAPFVYFVRRSRHTVPHSQRSVCAFPWWGWAGIVVVLATWCLAWNRFIWFEPFQAFTFTPLWLGYILAISGLTLKRAGHCTLRDNTGFFVALFPLSAAFWWFFEYLNRFVQNWYYIGAGELSAWEYFWQATLPFSTVLPAVLATREWLATYPRLSAGLATGWHLPLLEPRLTAAFMLLFAAIGLGGIGVWPDLLYPLLWLAPVLIIVSLQLLLGEKTLIDAPARGDWRLIWQAALAALICGFFWELWNYKSVPRWEYSIPLVHRLEIFHMPLLGYAGYLPFGLGCIAMASLIKPTILDE